MDIKTAQTAIKAILEAIPDEELPEFDKIEIDTHNGLPIAWWGGTGYCLGRAQSGGKRSPEGHRASAAWAAIEHEMVYRADRRLFENGDDPTGVRLARKVA